ncbi:hypothetical protein DFQ28_006504 [Apophysomyces sp. BC1034]|nr:hypothetical protein DFQ28_006504 [Apophysomyces sp. BC1034]
MALAGAILINMPKNQAVIFNPIEGYSLSKKDSLHCKVFLDRCMLDQAMAIVNNPGIHRLPDTVILGQLKAIRSKLHTTDV